MSKLSRAVLVTAVLLVIAGMTAWATGTQEEGAATMVDANFNETGLPIVDTPVTLDLVTRQRWLNGERDEMIFYNNLEEMTNVLIDWEAIPEAQAREKINLMLASGDYPDAFFGVGSVTTQDIVTYGEQGVFLQLDDLIDQYAPNIKNALETYPPLRPSVTTADGHMYSVARVLQNGGHFNPGHWFAYTPWMDELGYSSFENLEDYYDFLVEVRDNDMNGNGDSNDEIGFSYIINHWSRGMHSQFGAFGLIDTPDHVVVRDGELVLTAVQSEYKAAIEYFHKFHAEGLFDQEAFTQQMSELAAKGAADPHLLASFMSWNDFNVVPAEKIDDTVIIPPLGAPGQGEPVWYYDPVGNINPTGFVITTNNEYPEISMRWIDLFYDKQIGFQNEYGPIGYTLRETEGGGLDWNPVPEGMTFDNFRYKHAGGLGPSFITEDDWGDSVPPLDVGASIKLEENREFYMENTQAPMPSVWYTSEELDELRGLETDIMNYIDEMKAKWLADGGINDDWEGYLDRLDRMNVARLMEIYETAYGRYKAAAQ
jgi:putative aldouronate transport system substrate-binding protein